MPTFFDGPFRTVYPQLLLALQTTTVITHPRGLSVAHELTPVVLRLPVQQGAWVFSERDHRVVPMRFVLAELLWILSGSNNVEVIASYNKAMQRFSDDGQTLAGAYGWRMGEQLAHCIALLSQDPSTRRAGVSLYWPSDSSPASVLSKDVPCNVFLQWILRKNVLDLFVVSRSSDYVTGLSIDAIHWQLLLQLMVNELQYTMGPLITTGHVWYTIHSLHVYTSDLPIIQTWEVKDTPSTIPLCINALLQDVSEWARAYFRKDMTIDELMHPFAFSRESQVQVRRYHRLFQEYPNRVAR